MKSKKINKLARRGLTAALAGAMVLSMAAPAMADQGGTTTTVTPGQTVVEKDSSLVLTTDKAGNNAIKEDAQSVYNYYTYETGNKIDGGNYSTTLYAKANSKTYKDGYFEIKISDTRLVKGLSGSSEATSNIESQKTKTAKDGKVEKTYKISGKDLSSAKEFTVGCIENADDINKILPLTDKQDTNGEAVEVEVTAFANDGTQIGSKQSFTIQVNNSKAVSKLEVQNFNRNKTYDNDKNKLILDLNGEDGLKKSAIAFANSKDNAAGEVAAIDTSNYIIKTDPEGIVEIKDYDGSEGQSGYSKWERTIVAKKVVNVKSCA